MPARLPSAPQPTAATNVATTAQPSAHTPAQTPAHRHTSLVAALCRHIEAAEQPPSLDALATQAQMSPHHLHRIFKAVTGVTPKAYADAHRAHKVREALGAGQRVTEALHEAGFQAPSRFYEGARQRLGMTPTAFRGGGKDTVIHFAVAQCSLGAVLVAASAWGVCAISLGDDADALTRELQDRFPQAELIGADTDFERLVAQVIGLVEMPTQSHSLPLDVRGTAFQQRVWQALRDIPPGQTVSYTELAERIGSPTSVRAVARACASNTLAVAIPCHRVVRLNGELSGYRWGVARKQALLVREADPATPLASLASVMPPADTPSP
ncbi:bifunctional DNA-binding transcriptional regulator/O6-methylguanine-DNA methyltransferase Ada [Aquabacterium sp.]|uniref:bifunctional DNA-binding transcriptional regulator/O6-methylguanine-DNA methyltransferase Ada n=1 Tax=Aquabacterium TaxID=92793 RepID=UPI001DBC68E2|nr:bifunctional DNA-binding transcriptional regulator/O6-methylguanine-DNA methyltransferase Ada [Aquabacterium sp.]MBT9611257.1 bifunctional DNA-binding transcriptional regulator/O6-methylguanine-DNA methyltransferase Ada [Aquabacterium sp.]